MPPFSKIMIVNTHFSIRSVSVHFFFLKSMLKVLISKGANVTFLLIPADGIETYVRAFFPVGSNRRRIRELSFSDFFTAVARIELSLNVKN